MTASFAFDVVSLNLNDNCFNTNFLTAALLGRLRNLDIASEARAEQPRDALASINDGELTSLLLARSLTDVPDSCHSTLLAMVALVMAGLDLRGARRLAA